ncbi:hypothetical protein NQ315_002589 [Exocentrus adspersus]|uniref:Reverse transcriptase domain-containing protein n=1 Tax=Exocentrus adspersus TaxID=1586481 RepID=A0AAV8VU57_9CUCU|nr:hypothetical protein NQ315_002589 [Exocentrus adspersus]
MGSNLSRSVLSGENDTSESEKEPSSPVPSRNPKRFRRVILSSSESSDEEEQEGASQIVSTRAEVHVDPNSIVNTNIDKESLLGMDPKKLSLFGPPLNEGLVNRWQSYLMDGIDKESRDALSKVLFPANCPQLAAPTLNVEAEKLLSALDKKKDAVIQDKLGRGLTILGEAISTLLSSDKIPLELQTLLIPKTAESGKLFTEVHYLLSQHRKHQIYPHMGPITQKVAEQASRDELLFGQNFGEKCKAAQVVEKATLGTQVQDETPDQIEREDGNTEAENEIIISPGILPSETLKVDIEENCAGRIHLFLEQWELLTRDPLILSWVRGYKIPFFLKPYQIKTPNQRVFSKREKSLLQASIAELLKKGVISLCVHRKGEFLSSYFLVEKITGGYRFVLNLKSLNKFVETMHFKLENFKTVKDIIVQNCYMCTLDLKDAYYLIPIHKKYRKYLRFSFEGQLFEFNVLPFGLSTAPFVFCKLIKPILSFLRTEGLLSVNYLDDFLLLADSKNSCLDNVRVTVDLISKVGLIINFEKSRVTPIQNIKFLGFVWDSIKMTISLPDDKVLRASQYVLKVRNSDTLTIRLFAKLIGFLISICPAFTCGWVYTKSLEHEKCAALKRSHGNFESIMKLSRENILGLEWWSNNIHMSGCSLLLRTYDYEIFTYASTSGWGTVCGDQKANGFWTKSEYEYHILSGAISNLLFITISYQKLVRS